MPTSGMPTDSFQYGFPPPYAVGAGSAAAAAAAAASSASQQLTSVSIVSSVANTGATGGGLPPGLNAQQQLEQLHHQQLQLAAAAAQHHPDAYAPHLQTYHAHQALTGQPNIIKNNLISGAKLDQLAKVGSLDKSHDRSSQRSIGNGSTGSTMSNSSGTNNPNQNNNSVLQPLMSCGASSASSSSRASNSSASLGSSVHSRRSVDELDCAVSPAQLTHLSQPAVSSSNGNTLHSCNGSLPGNLGAAAAAAAAATNGNPANAYNNYNYGLYGVNLVGGVGNLMPNGNLIQNGLYHHHLAEDELLHHHAVSVPTTGNHLTHPLHTHLPMQVDEHQVRMLRNLQRKVVIFSIVINYDKKRHLTTVDIVQPCSSLCTSGFVGVDKMALVRPSSQLQCLRRIYSFPFFYFFFVIPHNIRSH